MSVYARTVMLISTCAYNDVCLCMRAKKRWSLHARIVMFVCACPHNAACLCMRAQYCLSVTVRTMMFFVCMKYIPHVSWTYNSLTQDNDWQLGTCETPSSEYGGPVVRRTHPEPQTGLHLPTHRSGRTYLQVQRNRCNRKSNRR